jgi:hypothetical protein
MKLFKIKILLQLSHLEAFALSVMVATLLALFIIALALQIYATFF